MAAVAVGDRIEHRRTFSFQQKGFLPRRRIGHGKGIEAVDPLGVHRILIDSRSHPGGDSVAHRLAGGLAAHRVEIVEDVHEERRIPRVVVPEGRILIHRSEDERFVDRTAGERTVADVGDDDSLPAVDFLVERRSHGDRSRTADDRVVRHRTEGLEEGVHRTAEPGIEAVLLRVDLGQRSIKNEVFGKVIHVFAFVMLFDDLEGVSAHVGLHDVQQLFLTQLSDRAHAFRQDLTVTAVGTEDLVIRVEDHRLSDRGAFLTGGEVGRTEVLVGDSLVHSFFLDHVEHRLELANQEHIVIDANQALLAIGLELFLHIAHIVVDGDFRQHKGVFLPQRCRIEWNLSGHDVSLLLSYRLESSANTASFNNSPTLGWGKTISLTSWIRSSASRIAATPQMISLL